MTKVLCATVKPFASEAVDKIRKTIETAGFEFALLEKYADQESLKEAVADADALIVRSDLVDAGVIQAGAKLKIVVRAGAGYDNIDLQAAGRRNVVAMNTPGQNSNAVAELALGMMVFMARNQFDGSSGTELRNKTLGVHAFGYVGRLVAGIARGFEMKVYAYDPFLDESVFGDYEVVRLDGLKELYRTCQYVSIHIPANEETRKSVNHELMSLMPAGAVLVNTARKEVIDEEALKRVMEERQDFRYASDIAPDNAEGLKAAYPGRCFFTPRKMGAQTEEANINAGVAAAEQIVAFLKKGDTTFRVN